MRTGRMTVLGAALVAPSLLILTMTPTAGRGEEPGRFGRLFRFGGPSSSASAAPRPAGSPAVEDRADPFPGPSPTTTTAFPAAGNPAQPRLKPQPRVSRPVTDADPLVTRISLGRSDDGTQFGMFLQVFADGTVIDSEGVHNVGRAGVKPVLAALESPEVHRLRGHCGAPSTDFVEQVQMVVYERSLGRLRANAFSFTGNPQGCDHAVRHLQTALEGLQTKLGRPTPGSTATPAIPTGAPAGVPSITPGPAPIQLNGGSGPAGN